MLKKQIIMLQLKTESKIPNISGLAIHSALTAVEDKVPDISNLVKKQIIMQK